VVVDREIPDFDAQVNRVIDQLSGSIEVSEDGKVTGKGASNRVYAIVADLYGINGGSDT
jgi:hypothetical protein